MKNKLFIYLSALAVYVLSSCSGFLDVTPSDKYSDKTVFTSTDNAQLVLTGAYDYFANGHYAHLTNQYMFFMPDIMGDDAMVNSTSNYGRFVSPYQYAVIPSSTYSVDPWINSYSVIDNCNAIVDNIGSLPASKDRDRIEGEALALRVYAYHFLIQMYAKPVNRYPNAPGVVLRLKSGIEDVPRSTVKDCYNQMTEDIERSCTLLANNSSSSKVYITERAAHAIAARLYLDLGDYTNGVSHANKALDGLILMPVANYKKDFCENNSETIWSYTCTATDKSNYLSLPSFWYYCDQDSTYVMDGYSSFGVTKKFIDIFDDSDVRKSFFVKIDGKYFKRNGSYAVCKIISRENGDAKGKGSGSVNFAEGEYNFLRASEMYLIIAELAADNDHEDVALDALNAVRLARGLSKYIGTGDNLKDEIQNERRRELFAEGHRLFDLKRRNLSLDRSSSENWSGITSLPAGSDKFELPIPQDEIDANNDVTETDQNPGY